MAAPITRGAAPAHGPGNVDDASPLPHHHDRPQPAAHLAAAAATTSTINEKTLADFVCVVEQSGILGKKGRLLEGSTG